MSATNFEPAASPSALFLSVGYTGRHESVRASQSELAEPIMQFYLVYSGRLPSSGNKGKPDHARDIRDKLHPQLELLWKTHIALKRLRWTARVPRQPGAYISSTETPFDPTEEPTHPLGAAYVDLCEPLQIGKKIYVPLVRKSLHLNCSLDIMFLRQQDPGELVTQGGDVDGRLKTLFDALRVPLEDVETKYPQAQDPTYCLLESDTLISGFNVQTGRLLTAQTSHAHEVHLVINIAIKVLRAGPWNTCLMGA